MAIDNIITMILVNGLPDEFKYMKDLMFSKETLLPTLAVPPGPTIMSAVTAIPTTSSQVKCGLCPPQRR